MDQFEAARLKHAKNLERRTRSLDVIGTTEAKISMPVVLEAPEEKSTDAVIEVSVRLPGGGFAFTLIKQSVAQNAVMSKLTKQNILNGVMKGLEPLLGTVKEK